MSRALTQTQKEAIRACITTDQRIEFGLHDLGFFVFTTKDVNRDQFVHLPDRYVISSASLVCGELRVFFWFA